MNITLHLHDGRKRTCHYSDGDKHVTARGLHCECSRTSDLIVAGTGRHREQDEHGESEDAACARCSGSVGRLVVVYSTLFGRTEDVAVLHGRPRVY
jgi:hypothetical protein